MLMKKVHDEAREKRNSSGDALIAATVATTHARAIPTRIIANAISIRF
jgi:hypothetical protein